LFVGGGAGGNYYTDEDFATIPIFANVRGYIPVKSRVRPFVDLKTGYGISTGSDYNGGFYVNATTGIEISHFTVGIGYSSQTLSVDGYDDYSFSTGGFTLNLGFAF
jgi:hypothetical protein